jgi:hypothetical protein
MEHHIEEIYEKSQTGLDSQTQIESVAHTETPITKSQIESDVVSETPIAMSQIETDVVFETPIMKSQKENLKTVVQFIDSSGTIECEYNINQIMICGIIIYQILIYSNRIMVNFSNDSNNDQRVKAFRLFLNDRKKFMKEFLKKVEIKHINMRCNRIHLHSSSTYCAFEIYKEI